MTTLFSEFLMKHLMLYGQPIIETDSTKLYFLEILSRVEFNGQIYQPNDFIPDMNIQMKFRLAQHLLTCIGKMQKIYPGISFSFNISALEVDMGIDRFIDEILSKPQTFGLDPKRCVIEITEHSSLEEENICNSLRKLKDMHRFRFALDDFGSKFATMNQIYNTNTVFDYIKIDGSLIRDIENDIAKQQTLYHIVEIIHIHKKQAVVEYVSSKDVYDVVSASNPDFLQGFFFGEPRPIEVYLEDRSPINLTTEWGKKYSEKVNNG